MKKPKMISCPICKGEKSEFEFVTLKDGVLCFDCAEKVVAAHPVIYSKNPEYKFKVYSTYDRKLDRNFNERVDNGLPEDLREYYGLDELTLEEYQQRLDSMEDYRAGLRSIHKSRAAFQITEVFELAPINPFEVGIFEARKYKDAQVCIGRCIVGDFKANDVVNLIHDGNEYSARVLGAEYEKDYELEFLKEYINRKGNASFWVPAMKKESAIEGHAGYIILEKGIPQPTPGDKILKVSSW